MPSAAREVIQRGLREVIDPAEPRAHADLTLQLHGGLKQVHHEPEFVPVEVVDRGQRLRGIVAVPAQEPADMRPVFLLDMGIVVFLVGALPEIGWVAEPGRAMLVVSQDERRPR
ncbi:MAG: hypothetical protein QN168_02345, partial [Armatimonadota bacterium]|nr:hypothetical protein [Armatimonadota bacterium]